ncbi:transcription factor protein [Ciona intestinalis]
MLGSMYESEDIPLFGGNLLGDGSLGMGHEELVEKLVGGSTMYMQTAPSSGVCYQENPLNDTSGLSLGSEWMTDNIDLSLLDDLVDSGFLGNQEELKNNAYYACQPISPASSFDSGVASPGSSSYPSIESPVSNYSGSDSYIDTPLEQLSPSPANTAVNTLSTEQNAFPDFGIDGDLLLEELGIKVIEDNNCETSFPSFEVNEVQPTTTNSINCGSELSFLLSTSNAQPAHQTPPVPQVNQVNFIPVETLPPPPKSRGGRKSKVTTTVERKQRKRDQNKNAATRYRERKRLEFSKQESEQRVLEDKNKSLHDNVNRVTREIEYLKELMIEVYKIKGLIK